MNQKSTINIAQILTNPNSVKLSAFFLFIYFIIYGVYTCDREFFYCADEIRDFWGSRQALEVYLCNGRWGLAIYKWVFKGLAPLNGVLIAGIWISLALVLQINILQIGSLSGKILYGLVVFCIPTLSYHFTFANQCDAFGLGIFLCSLGVYFSIKENACLKIIGGILFLISLSFYQSLVLNIVVLYAGRLLHTQTTRTVNYKSILFQALPLLVAIIIYIFISKIAENCAYISNEMREHVQTYQSDLFNPKSYFLQSGDSMAQIGKAVNNLLQLMIGKNVAPLYSCCGILIILSSFIIIKNKQFAPKECIFIILNLLLITAVPFLIPIVGNSDTQLPGSIRSYTAAPFAGATIWVFTFSLFRIGGKHWVGPALTIIMSPFILHSAYFCAYTLKSWQTGCSIIIREFILLEHEAEKTHAAQKNAQPLKKIILFGGERYFPFDDCYHPYIQYIHVPSKSESEKYREKAESLPCYPAPGSIHSINDDTVIVNYSCIK